MDQQEPSIPKSASVADADVATDFEDIDALMSVLAHVKLAQTSCMSFIYLFDLNVLTMDSNRRDKAGTKCPCISQGA